MVMTWVTDFAENYASKSLRTRRMRGFLEGHAVGVKEGLEKLLHVLVKELFQAPPPLPRLKNVS